MEKGFLNIIPITDQLGFFSVYSQLGTALD